MDEEPAPRQVARSASLAVFLRLIFLAPREAMRLILADHPRKHALLLTALFGYALIPNQPLTGRGMTGLALLCITLSIVPLLAIGMLYMRAFVAAHVGRWLGGTAPAAHVRAAVSWAWLPFVVVAAIRAPAFAAEVARVADWPLGTFPAARIFVEVGEAFEAFAPVIWTLVLISILWCIARETIMVAEVHGITSARALVAIIASVVLPVAGFVGAIVLVDELFS